MKLKYLTSFVVFVFYSSTHKALGKIEVLPLPQEEQACFDKERVHGDLSRVIGHMVLEKCVYATEMLKKHFDTSKFSEPTVKWFKGLIEQTVHEGQRLPAPDFAHYNIRGKRQAQQGVRFGTQQRAPFAPQQWAQVAAQTGAQQGVPFGTPQEIPFGTPQEIPFGTPQEIPFGTPPGQSEIPQNAIGAQEQPYFRIRKEYRMLSDMERNLFHRAFQMLKADTSVSPSKFDALGQLHESSVQRGHYGPAFLPWHRLFLLMVENALREKIPSVTMPYWDSTLDSALLDPRSSIIWTPRFLGYGFGYVTDGPFANWNTPYGQILRSFGQEGALFNWTSINNSLSMNHLEDISFPNALPENNLEDHHIQVHLWVGGFMAPPALAAFDPVFYLLHAYVDLIWELFRNLQRRRGVDPTSDYPMDTNVTGHGYNDTAGLGTYSMHHGLRDHFTNNIYKYQVPPSCTRDHPSCGSNYIRCDTKGKIPRCVSTSIFDPIRMFTARGIPMDGSSGVREFKRSTRKRTRNRQAVERSNMIPAEIFINGSADLNYANTFVLDGKRDPHSWAYIPVTVKYQHLKAESKARVNDWCDKNGTTITISVVSDGFNYHGQYKQVQLIDTTVSEVTFTSLIGLRLPNETKDTEVLLSAYDACGRMCQPTCSHKAESCTGALKLTVQKPYEYFSFDEKLRLDEEDPVTRQKLSEPIRFLSFTCSSALTDWIW